MSKLFLDVHISHDFQTGSHPEKIVSLDDDNHDVDN